jgi:hypothetical protein
VEIRHLFRWAVSLVSSDGSRTKQVEFNAYWSPDSVTTEEVAQAAAAQERVQGDKQPWLPVSAVLITEEAIAA